MLVWCDTKYETCKVKAVTHYVFGEYLLKGSKENRENLGTILEGRNRMPGNCN